MKGRKGTLTRLRDERGVTTVVVVVSLIGIFSAVVLSLGFGSAWANRRVIITATDGAALQQARLAALSGTACDDAARPIDNWSDFLSRNAKDITFQNCDLVPDAAHPGTGYVLVEANKTANAPFGGLFGIGSTQPYSLSAVEYGFAPKPEGLRPMAFCLDNAHVLQWIWYQNWRIAQGEIEGTVDPSFGQIMSSTYNGLKGTLDAGRPPVKGVDYSGASGSVLFKPPPGLPGDGLEPRIDYPLGSDKFGTGGTSYLSYGVVHRMFFTKDDIYEGGNCPSDIEASGNWGWIDLDGRDNSTNLQKEWTEEGYDGQVAADDCNADEVSGDPCFGDPGSSGGANQQALDSLIANQTQFYIPIFSNITCPPEDPAPCPGENSAFQIWGFLPLILRGYLVTGQEQDRFFDFEFKDVITSGPCCSKTGGIGTPKGIRICGVDHDGATTDAIIAARCGQGTSGP